MSLYEAYEDVLTALFVYREARGESFDAKRAVVHVILNRTKDAKGRWPKLRSEAILQPLQFSSFNRNDPNATVMPHWNNRAWRECCQAVECPGEDPTGGANHYHSIPEGQPLPKWATPEKITARIGAFTFYKL